MINAKKHTKFISKIRVTPKQREFVEKVRADNEKCLLQMQQLSNFFYNTSVKIGNHAFIEFAGLMNEYIKACEMAHQRGEDFTNANVHTGKAIIPDFMKDYFLEKVGCIFGMEEKEIYEYLHKKHGEAQ